MESTATELLGSIIYSLPDRPDRTPIYLGETDKKLGTIKVECENNKCVIRLWFDAGDAQ